MIGMEKPIIFIALLILLPLSLWFWVKRLNGLWINANKEKEEASNQPNTESEELVTEAYLAVYRDLFLAILFIGAILYYVLSLSAPAIREVAFYFYDIANALKVYEPLTNGGQMNSIINLLIRIMLSIGSFLITFGLSAAFLPELFPQRKGTKLSNSLSFGTAFFLAATFSLWLGTSSTAFGIVIDQLTRGFLGVVTTFLSVLFGAIGAYLIWKRIKTSVKPF